jgi:hypothetical protein
MSSCVAKVVDLQRCPFFLHVVMWRIAYGGTTLKDIFHEENLLFL